MNLAESGLILVDFQNDFLHGRGLTKRLGIAVWTEEERQRAVKNARLLVDRMKAMDRPVVWVTTELRSDHLDSGLSPLFRALGLTRESGFLVQGSWGSEIIEGFSPEIGGLMVTKKGHSAFQGTDLDRLLSNLGVNTCVLLGGGVCDGLPDSVRQAGALGYEVIVPADATGYPSGSAHIQNLWNRALITTTREILDALSRVEEPLAVHSKTALLLVDLQNDFVDPDGFQHRMGYARLSAEERAVIIRNNQRLVQAMGERGAPIIFTVTAYRKDKLDDAAPPIAPRNKPIPPGETFLLEGSWGVKVVSGLEIQEGDFVITKKGRSAFGFTPLHRILRNLNVMRCVVTGGGIHGCVEDTIREGVGLGYSFTVVSDAVYEPNSPILEVMASHTEFKTTDEILVQLQK
jgi:nicotinamidase-related amidase